MSSILIQDNWPERVIKIASGETIRLIADDPDGVTMVRAVNSQNQEIGQIGFFRFEHNFRGDEALLITSLNLDNLGLDYTRQGIGEAILRMIKENSELPIVASCPLSTTEKADGSHLIRLGPNFVRKMRELVLIEEVCDGDCLCGPDPSMDDDEGYYEE
jgi:hypothetical protein